MAKPIEPNLKLARSEPDMSPSNKSTIPAILKKHEGDLLAVWMKEQTASLHTRKDLMKEHELREQSTDFLRLLQEATQTGDLTNVSGNDWAAVRDFLDTVSRSRALQGFAPSEMANFVFSL